MDGKPVCGLVDFADDGSVAVFVKPSLEVSDAVEILAHELAHVAVGVEHDHDEVWQEAFDKIFEEYNRIGDQMFPAGEQRVRRTLMENELELHWSGTGTLRIANRGLVAIALRDMPDLSVVAKELAKHRTNASQNPCGFGEQSTHPKP